MTINNMITQQRYAMNAAARAQMETQSQQAAFGIQQKNGAQPGSMMPGVQQSKAAKSGSMTPDFPQTGSAQTRSAIRTAAETIPAAALAAANEQIASAQNSLMNWRIQNQPAATFSPSTRVSDILSDPVQARVMEMQEQQLTARRSDALQNLVSRMFTTQARGSDAAENLSFNQKGSFAINAETKEEAEEAVSDKGYWGTEQTSSRMLKYASALLGSDESKQGMLQNAFVKGYEQAEKAWGREMPDVVQRTRDLVLNQFQTETKEQENKPVIQAVGAIA